MKTEKTLNILRFKNGLRSLILLLYVFSFSGYTGHIHTPQTTPVKTEQLVAFNRQFNTKVKAYKQIVQGFYISRFQIFSLKYSAVIQNVLEYTWFKVAVKNYDTIVPFLRINLMWNNSRRNTEYPLISRFQ